MDCPRIPILGACIVGAVLGAILYGIASRRKDAFSGFLFLEAMTQGFLLAGASHLMMCIFCPDQLVEIIDKATGREMHHDTVIMKIENLHAIEIFIASVLLGLISVRALNSIWNKPGH